jgi:ABC-type dipeptide/oligopeptide/nickel transport system permease component
MTRYILRRLAQLIPVLLGISVMVFALLHLIPGDPAAIFLGQEATPAEIARLRHILGLDEPLLMQFGKFLLRLVHGDLGVSITQNVPVGGLVLKHLPATVELAVTAMVIAIVIAIPLGVISATRKGSVLDLGSLILAQLGVSMPVFWLGMLMITTFALRLHWLPTFGRGPSFSEAFVALAKGDFAAVSSTFTHILMPAMAMGLTAAALITRMVRSTMLEVLQQDYVRTARAKGISEFKVIFRHALRNALLPVVTIVGLQFGAMLGGAVVTESIFAWPGVGRLAVEAIGQRDFPVIQGTVLSLALSFSVMNLLVDLSYAYINPKIRYD